MIEILNKILVMLFIMAILNIIRQTYYFIQAWIRTSEEETVDYKISTTSLVILAISISYLISSLIMGITIN